MVKGNIEKSLNLGRVQIDRDDAVCARAFEEIRAELRGNRDAPFVFTVLPRVSEVGNDRGDSRGAGASQTVDDDEQFHEHVVHGAAGRLDDVNVFSSDVFFDATERLPVGELLNPHLTGRDVQVIANFLKEIAVGGTGENFNHAHWAGLF